MTLAKSLYRGIIASALSVTIAFCGAAQKKIVALTFDDGPNTSTTVKVLDVLKENDVAATFFLCGKNINKDTRPIMKRAVTQGCELGNHSRTHSDMRGLTVEKMRMEIEYTSHIIKQTTGVASEFFRPPYLLCNDLMHSSIKMPFIGGFSIEDWLPEVDAAERARRVVAKVKPGDIILLHDFEGNDATVDALKTIIPELKKQGYTFVTVGNLFKEAGIEPQAHNKRLYSNVYEQE